MAEENNPKIIVDDDWKEQVRKEKEQFDQQSKSEPNENQIPEASFSLLVTSLTTQALAALGFVPNPATGKAEVDRSLAKHFIDSLGVLQEKTAGNLTADESGLLNESLHQLRMAFLSPSSAASAESDGDTEKSSTIELP